MDTCILGFVRKVGVEPKTSRCFSTHQPTNQPYLMLLARRRCTGLWPAGILNASNPRVSTEPNKGLSNRRGKLPESKREQSRNKRRIFDAFYTLATGLAGLSLGRISGHECGGILYASVTGPYIPGFIPQRTWRTFMSAWDSKMFAVDSFGPFR